jgi:hypothetical protein
MHSIVYQWVQTSYDWSFIFYDNQMFFLQLHTYKYIAELCYVYRFLFILVNLICISPFEQTP